MLSLFVSTMHPFVTISSADNLGLQTKKTSIGKGKNEGNLRTQDVMCFLNVEHNIQLANIFEVLVESFDEGMDELQHTQFILQNIHLSSVKVLVECVKEQVDIRELTSSSCSTPTMKKREA
jgi:hypothetical protein